MKRPVEAYALACWRCRAELEIPCTHRLVCSVCGALLTVQWRDNNPARVERKIKNNQLRNGNQ